MADALTIDFAVTNLSKVEQAFQRMERLSAAADARLTSLATRADAAASAYGRLNAQIAIFNRTSSGGGGSRPTVIVQMQSSGSSSSIATASAAKAASTASGPYQRRRMLEQQMQAATARNDHDHIADISIAQKANAKHIARVEAPEKNLGDKFMDVLKTSRFGVGPGGKVNMMPLVGRTASLAAEALGPEVMALAGPVGIVVGAVIAASTAIFNLAKGAAEASVAFTSFQFATGNMGAGASAALAIGRQGGLSADATAGQANSLQEAITGSSVGRMYGMSLGVSNLSGQYGSQDYATQYKTAIDNLRKMPMEQRILTARQTGLTGSLGATMTSNSQYAFTGQDSDAHAKIFDPAFAEKSANFNAALGRLEDAGTNLMAALGKPFLDSLTNFFDRLATGINQFALFMNSPAGQLISKSMFGVSSIVGSVLDHAGNGQTAQQQATQDNTKALHGLTAVLPGVYGNDTDGRRDRAMPGAAGVGAMSRSRGDFASGAIRLGAF